MKKLFAFCAGLLAVLNQTAVTALAAEPEAAGAAAQTPLWLCIPFAGLLLCIAVLPLVKAEWWEAHQPHAVVFWSLLFLIPFAVKYGVPKAAETTLECIINDYLTFIVLLFGLFCVSGNITLSGDLAGSPRINVGLLALGTLLSSWIGTTGASMLMIRPIIKMNAWRKRRRHIVIFFIFMVSNMGGCLTPIGDPPLLMGFMRGVPFFWSLKLLPILIFNMIILLFIFYHFDMKAYRKDIAAGLKPDISKPGTEVTDPRQPQPDLYHYDRDRRYLKRYPAVHADVSGCRRKCPRDSCIWRSYIILSGDHRVCDHPCIRISVL